MLVLSVSLDSGVHEKWQEGVQEGGGEAGGISERRMTGLCGRQGDEGALVNCRGCRANDARRRGCFELVVMGPGKSGFGGILKL